MIISNKKYSLSEHFYELKIRLTYIIIFFFLSFITSYIYVEQIYDLLLKPLAQQWINQDKHMIYTGLTEIFFSYLKLAYYAAIFITLPFFLCQLYIFIAPGLYKNEKKAILPFLIFSPILFITGIIFVYNFIFPLAWSFFLNFENYSFNAIPIKLEARISEYLSLVINMMLAFGMAFQMPIILALLAKVGIIDANMLRNKRRFAIVIIFIIAAILTPPDAISQIGLAIPMIMLYEISIIICSKMNKENYNA